MLKFDFANCYEKNVGGHGISRDAVKRNSAKLQAAHEKFMGWRKLEDAIFFDYPATKGLTKSIKKTASEYKAGYENLVILGIGGSALGLSFIANALLPPHHNIFTKDKRLFVYDNIDPDSFDALIKNLDLKKTLFNVISKSGGTVETASQFFIVVERLKKKLKGKWKGNVIATTDPSKGVLRNFVDENGIASLAIPPKLGGRFSVLSAVGLFPLSMLGVDIDSIIEGALRARKYCLSGDPSKNPALELALISYLIDVEKKKNISVMIPYGDSLKLFADWYSQLWAESLGKEGLGTTPVKALGATDQHSQLQLYMEGPNDKLVTFVGVDKFAVKCDKVQPCMDGFDYVKGKTLADLIKAEMTGTRNALSNMKRPNLTITLPKVDPSHIGELILFYETATALTGALYGINPFDQPGVELGKKITKEILMG